MSRYAAIRLVKSLSKSEKRQFKLFAKRQSGNKDYLDLFNIIDRQAADNPAKIEQTFLNSHPKATLNNVANYLVKVLTDCLVHTRVNENNPMKLLYGLLKVNVLNERRLYKEAFHELRKLQQPAHTAEEQLLQLILNFYEQDYYARHHFKGLSEQKLIRLQVQTRESIKRVRNLYDHYSLYDTLKFRLSQSRHSISEEDQQQLNDLVLSEISIINARVKNNLESKKLHLLFQSYFFTNIGDYRSALKSFFELNKLFEHNLPLLKNPPEEYFSALDGILDCLRSIQHFEQMPYYIDRLQRLNNAEYPDYFRSLVQKTVLIYTLASFVGKGQVHLAANCLENGTNITLKEYPLLDKEKQNELFFYHALVCFRVKKMKEAQKYIQHVVLTNKINFTSIVYRALRLINILIHYELKDFEYLNYEIRTYQRSLKGTKILKTEKLVFKVIKINPAFNNDRKNELLWPSLSPLLPTIQTDKFELQLLKYFDFINWVKAEFKK